MALQLREQKTQKIALAVMLGCALLYVYFLTNLFPFTYRAGAAELRDLSGRYEALNRDLIKAKQTIHSLAYLEKEHEMLTGRWEMAQRLLPDEDETASLLRAMTLLGEQSGVEFLLFRPGSAHPVQYYTEHPVDVKVAGGYHDVGAFLGEVANMERIVTVGGLKIESADEKDAATDASAVAAFTATTYTLGGTGVPPEEGEEIGGKKGATKGKSAAKEVTRKLKAKQRGGSSDE